MTQSELTQGGSALKRGHWVDGRCLGRWVLLEPGVRPGPGRRETETGLRLAQRPTHPTESYRKGASTNVARANPGAGLRGGQEERAGDRKPGATADRGRRPSSTRR